MVKSLLTAVMLLALVGVALPLFLAGQASKDQAPALGDPQQYKRTMLERMRRAEPTYRGDNDMRLKWEWYDGMSRSYLFEKNAIVEEASTGQPHMLRPQWVLRNVKVSFQEIFQLSARDDEKLIPILSYMEMLSNAPSATFEGLTLYGKEGEVKGTITRKYTVSTMDYPVTWANAGVLRRGYFVFVDALEYKDPKSGKLEIARGNAYDAVNLRWKDIKNRNADDMSEEKAAEDRRLLREAYAKSLKDSVPER
jgi:hypothetical protein